MRFYTENECKAWLSDRERDKPDAIPGTLIEQMPYPPTPGRFSVGSQVFFAEPALDFQGMRV